MYHHIWKKYVAFINILLKRSASGEQVLNLNRIDFEKAGTGRKAGYKFTIQFTKGRVSNLISNCRLAADLATAMLEDENTKNILRDKAFEVSMSPKFQLTVKNLDPSPQLAPKTEEELEPALH